MTSWRWHLASFLVKHISYETTTHSRILDCKILWIEGSGRLQSTGTESDTTEAIQHSTPPNPRVTSSSLVPSAQHFLTSSVPETRPWVPPHFLEGMHQPHLPSVLLYAPALIPTYAQQPESLQWLQGSSPRAASRLDPCVFGPAA